MKSSMKKFVTSIAVALMAIGLVSCTEPKSITCKTGIICPAGTKCAEHEKKCLSPDDKNNGIICGDGVIDADKGEECDDGNTIDYDGCSALCKLESCGDGIVQRQFIKHTYDEEGLLIISSTVDPTSVRIEICDPGEAGVGPEKCLAEDAMGGDGQIVRACQSNLQCGNGVVDPGEVCDHGNGLGGNGSFHCSKDCGSTNECGNGILDNDPSSIVGRTPEECDKGDVEQGLSAVFNLTQIKQEWIEAGLPHCLDSCVVQLCGDGKVNGDEQCDPGIVGSSSVICNSDCTLSECGDGIVNGLAGEECDGDLNDASQWAEDATTGKKIWKGSADCTKFCKHNICGDEYFFKDSEGNLKPNHNGEVEECDDGNRGSNFCTRACKKNICGDMFIGKIKLSENGQNLPIELFVDICEEGKDDKSCFPEQCDDGPDGSRTCTKLCTRSSCGDGIVNEVAQEKCDSGAEEKDNAGNWANCNYDCTLPVCGDGILNESAGEQCDHNLGEGGTIGNRLCNFDCTVSKCGDGKINAQDDEYCDPGDASRDANDPLHNWATCNYDCTKVVCGDKLVNTAANEQCDHGLGENSQVGTAACNYNCTLSTCGDGIVNKVAGEECDDGSLDDESQWNVDETTGVRTWKGSVRCNSDCTFSVCGDGKRNAVANEVCDHNLATRDSTQNTWDTDGISLNPALWTLRTEEQGGSANCNWDCKSVSVCGDGVVNPGSGEECDHNLGEGSETGTAVCNSDCTFAICGDGKVNTAADEVCDHGQAVRNADVSIWKGEGAAPAFFDLNEAAWTLRTKEEGGNAACNWDCKSVNACGDGIVNKAAGEVCDPDTGTTSDSKKAQAFSLACNDDCTESRCGDGKINNFKANDDDAPVETCDDAGGNITQLLMMKDALAAFCTGKDDQAAIFFTDDQDNSYTFCKSGNVILEYTESDFADEAQRAAANTRLRAAKEYYYETIYLGGALYNNKCFNNAFAAENRSIVCQKSECGNGKIDFGEVCESVLNDDGTIAYGEDGKPKYIDIYEKSVSYCSTDCRSTGVCGNGIVDNTNGMEEVCDPPTNGCLMCESGLTCGNGKLESGEACDTGSYYLPDNHGYCVISESNTLDSNSWNLVIYNSNPTASYTSAGACTADDVKGEWRVSDDSLVGACYLPTNCIPDSIQTKCLKKKADLSKCPEVTTSPLGDCYEQIEASYQCSIGVEGPVGTWTVSACWVGDDSSGSWIGDTLGCWIDNVKTDEISYCLVDGSRLSSTCLKDGTHLSQACVSNENSDTWIPKGNVCIIDGEENYSGNYCTIGSDIYTTYNGCAIGDVPVSSVERCVIDGVPQASTSYCAVSETDLSKFTQVSFCEIDGQRVEQGQKCSIESVYACFIDGEKKTSVELQGCYIENVLNSEITSQEECETEGIGGTWNPTYSVASQTECEAHRGTWSIDVVVTVENCIENGGEIINVALTSANCASEFAGTWQEISLSTASLCQANGGYWLESVLNASNCAANGGEWMPIDLTEDNCASVAQGTWTAFNHTQSSCEDEDVGGHWTEVSLDGANCGTVGGEWREIDATSANCGHFGGTWQNVEIANQESCVLLGGDWNAVTEDTCRALGNGTWTAAALDNKESCENEFGGKWDTNRSLSAADCTRNNGTMKERGKVSDKRACNSYGGNWTPKEFSGNTCGTSGDETQAGEGELLAICVTKSCNLATCGDGYVQTNIPNVADGEMQTNPELITATETCDHGSGKTEDSSFGGMAVDKDGYALVGAVAGQPMDGASNYCNYNCQINECGDGITNAAAGEQCDWGMSGDVYNGMEYCPNMASTCDVCTKGAAGKGGCVWKHVGCGNGKVEYFENTGVKEICDTIIDSHGKFGLVDGTLYVKAQTDCNANGGYPCNVCLNCSEAKKYYSVTAVPDNEHGTIVASSIGIYCNSTSSGALCSVLTDRNAVEHPVEFQAIPEEGYRLANWNYPSDVCEVTTSDDENRQYVLTCKAELIDSTDSLKKLTIGAVFVAENYNVVVSNAAPDGQVVKVVDETTNVLGSVSGICTQPEGAQTHACGCALDEAAVNYVCSGYAGDTITLTATPNAADGYVFIRWEGGCPNVKLNYVGDTNTVASAECTGVVGTGWDIQPVFKKQYKLHYGIASVNAEGGSISSSVASDTLLDADSEVALVAVSNPGYTFTGWGTTATVETPDFTCLDNSNTSNPCIIRMTHDTDVFAFFNAINPTIDISSRIENVGEGEPQILCNSNSGDEGEGTTSADCVEFQCRESGNASDTWGDCSRYATHDYYTKTIEIKRHETGVAAESAYYQFTSWTGCTAGCDEAAASNMCCHLTLVSSNTDFVVKANYASNKMRVDFSTQYDVTGENAVFNCADRDDSGKNGLCSDLVFERNAVVTASLSLEGSTCQSDKFISMRDHDDEDKLIQAYCECVGGILTNCKGCGEDEATGDEGNNDASTPSGDEGDVDAGNVTPDDENDAGEGDEGDEDAEVIPGGGESGSGMVCTAKEQYHKTLEGGVPSLQLTLDQNRTVDVTYTRASTAKVSIAPYLGSNINGTVTLTTSASANVAGAIQGIVAYCYGESKGNCSADVGLNLELKADAEAADGYEFVGWRITGSGRTGEFINATAPIITLTSDTAVVPIFAPSLSVSMNRSIAAAQIRCGFDVVADASNNLLISCRSAEGTNCEGVLDTTTTAGESHCLPADGSDYVNCAANSVKYRINSSDWNDGSDGYYMYRACNGGQIIETHTTSGVHNNSSSEGTPVLVNGESGKPAHRCVIASNTGKECNGAYAYGTQIALETLYLDTYDEPQWKINGAFVDSGRIYSYTEGEGETARTYYGYNLSFAGLTDAMANYTISTKQQVAYENNTSVYGCYITQNDSKTLNEDIESSTDCDAVGGSWELVSEPGVNDDIECWQYGWVANVDTYGMESDISSGIPQALDSAPAITTTHYLTREGTQSGSLRQTKTRNIVNPGYEFVASKIGSSAEECAMLEKNESLAGTTFFLLKVKASTDREMNWRSRTSNPYTNSTYVNGFEQNTYCSEQLSERVVTVQRNVVQKRLCKEGGSNRICGGNYYCRPFECYSDDKCYRYESSTNQNGYVLCDSDGKYKNSGYTNVTHLVQDWPAPNNLTTWEIAEDWSIVSSVTNDSPSWENWICNTAPIALPVPNYKGYSTTCLPSAENLNDENEFKRFVTSAADVDWNNETTCAGYFYVRLDSLSEGTTSFAYSPKNVVMEIPGEGVAWKSIKVADNATSADVPVTASKTITAVPGQTVIAIAEAKANYSMADWVITGATCQHESTEAYSKAICQFVMPVGDVTLKPVAQETSHTLKLAVSGGTATCAIAAADAADCSAEGLTYSSANCQRESNTIASTTKLCVKVVPTDDTYELLGEPRCFLGTDLASAANQSECEGLTGCYVTGDDDSVVKDAEIEESACVGANQTWKTATWQSTINGTSDVTYSCISSDDTNYPTVITSFVDGAQVGKTCLVNMATDNTVSANFTRKPQLSASIIPPKTEGSDEGGRNMSCGYKFGLDTEVFHCLNEWMTHDTYYFSGTNIQLNAELGTDGYEFLESNNRQSCNGGTWAPNAVCSFIMSGPKTYSAYALFSLKPLLNVVFTPTDGGTLHHADVACDSPELAFGESTWSVGATSETTGSDHCLKATPSSFYEFLTTNNMTTCNGGEWTAAGASEPTSYLCSVHMTENAGDAHVNAIFTRRPVITVSSNADASTGTIACCDTTCKNSTDGSYKCCTGADCCTDGFVAVSSPTTIPSGAQFPVASGDSFCVQANVLAAHTLFDLENSKCPGATENKWTVVTENESYRCNIADITNTGAYTDTSVTAGFMKDGAAATTVIAHGDGLVQCKTIKTADAATCADGLTGLAACGHSTDITHYLGADESLCVVAAGSDSTHTELNKAMSFAGCTGGSWSDEGVCVVAAGNPTVVVNFTAKPKLTTSVVGSGKLVSCENSSTEVAAETSYHSYASVAGSASSVDVCALPAEGNTMDTASGCPGSSWNYVGNSYKCTVTMDSDKAVQASFTTIQTYDVNVTNSGNGSLKCVHLDTGADCSSANFATASDCGVKYTLTKHLNPATNEETLDYLCVQASTDADYIFKANTSFCPSGVWTTDAVTGNSLCSVKYGESTATVVATFKAQPKLTVALNCPLEYNDCGNITISPTLTADGDSTNVYHVAAGTEVTLSATIADAAKDAVEFLAANNSGCPSSLGWEINPDHDLAICIWTMGEDSITIEPRASVKPLLTVNLGEDAAINGDNRVSCVSPFANVADATSYHLTGENVTVCVQPGPTHTLNMGNGCDGRMWTLLDSANGIYSCTVTMDSNKTVTATYTDIPSYTVSINGNGMMCAKSTVNVGSENSVDCTSLTYTTACGTSQTLTMQDNKGEPADTVDVLCIKGVSTDDLFFDAAASSCDGAAFTGGTPVNGVVDSGYCKVVYGKDAAVTGATRAQPTLTCQNVCTPTLTGCSGITVSGDLCSKQVKAGTEIQATVDASANENYEFLAASNTTSCNGGAWTGNSCTLIMSAAGNNEVRANYSLKPMLNFSSTCSPELTGGVCTAPTVTVGGTALTSGSYIATDSTVSAAANAPENYEFLPANNANTCNGGVWTGNAADGYTCSFTATGKESYSITPVYSQKPNVTAEAVCSPALSEGTCGTLTSETTGYQATGTSITVTAAATGNYEFLPANNGTTCNGGAWTKPENSDYTCTFVANANATNSVRPVFTQKPKLTLVQRPSSSATFYDCTGEEASAISETELYYATGTSVSICVTTGAGYTFNDSASTCPDGSWTDSGTMKKCSVTMNGDKSIVVVSDAQNAGALYVSSEGTGAGSLQCAVGTYKYYNGWGENNVSTSNLTCPPDGSSYSSCDASYILNSTTGPSYGWNNSQNSYKKYLCVQESPDSNSFMDSNTCNAIGGNWTESRALCRINYNTSGGLNFVFTKYPTVSASIQCMPAPESGTCGTLTGPTPAQITSDSTSVSVSVTPSSDYEFLTSANSETCSTTWTSSGDTWSCNWTMGLHDANVSVTPVLTKKPQLTVSMGEGMQIVACNGETEVVTSGAIYTTGTSVKVCVGVTDSSYRFDPETDSGCPAAAGWQNDGATGNYSCQLTMVGDKVVTASAVIKPYLALVVEPTGSGAFVACPDDASSVVASGYYYGNVNICVQANAGYEFSASGWTETATAGIYKKTVNVTSSQMVTATFIPMPQLTVNLLPEAGGSTVDCTSGNAATVDGPYATNSSVDVCVKAAENYAFDVTSACGAGNWSALTGEQAGIYTCSVTMSGDQSVSASFTSLTRTVSVSANGSGTVAYQVISSGTCADATEGAYAAVTEDIGLNSGDTLCVKGTVTGADDEFKPTASTCPGTLTGSICSVAYADVESVSDRHVIMTFGAKPVVTVNVTGDGQIVACEASGAAFVSGAHVATGGTADICVKASDGYQFNSSVGCPGTDGWTANGDNYKCHLAVSGDTNVYAGFNAVAASQMTVLVNSIGGASKCQVIDANLSCPVVGDVSYTACTSSYVVAQDKQLCVTDGNDASAHVELNTASSFCAGQTFMGKLCDVPYTDNNPKTVVMVYAAEPTLTINAPANSWTLYEGGACTGTAITNLQHPTGTQLCVKAGTVAGATFDPSDGCNSGAWTQMGMGEDYTCNVTMAANSAVTLNFIGTGTLAVTTNLTGEPLPDYYEVFNGACGTENPASAVVGNFNEGTTLCVKQKAVTGYTFNDASGCPGTGWTLNGNVYQCEVTIAKGVTSTVTMNYAASAAFSIAVSGGTGYTDYSVATGTCALASSFATLSGTESYPVGQQLCIKALAEDDAHHLVLDTTRGCMWSDAGEGYYVCDVTVRAPSTAMTIYVNPWGTLTVGTGVTVTQNACGETAGGSVADNAQVKSGTVLCATASKTNLLTTEGCPGGTWDTTGSDATCQFTMGSGNASVLANYELPEGQKTLTIMPSGTGAVVYTGACTTVTAESTTTSATAFDANTALCVVVDDEDTTNHRSLDVSAVCHGTANWTDMANLTGKHGCDITIGSENVTLALSYIAYGQVSLVGTATGAALYSSDCGHVTAETATLTSGDYLKAGVSVCAKVTAPGEYFDSASGCNGGAWTASSSDYICDVTIVSDTNTAVTLSYFDSTELHVTAAAGSAAFSGVTVAASTCSQAILANSTFSEVAASYRSGTSICVKVPADDATNHSSFDAATSTGCLWIARENEYICDVSMSGDSVTLTLNAIAWPVLTNAAGLTVKTGNCTSGTAVEFDAEAHTASIKAGTVLCASVAADNASSSIDTTTGCPDSAWVVDGATAACTFAMPSSAAAIAASYTAWPVLTKGSGVTVYAAANGVCTATEITESQVKAGTALCAQAAKTSGEDPVLNIVSDAGCPEGTWNTSGEQAVCLFAMGASATNVTASYAAGSPEPPVNYTLTRSIEGIEVRAGLCSAAEPATPLTFIANSIEVEAGTYCATVAASGTGTVLDQMSGCPGSTWTVDGATAVCQFTVSANTAISALYENVYDFNVQLAVGSANYSAYTVSETNCESATSSTFASISLPQSYKAGTSLCLKALAEDEANASSLDTSSGCLWIPQNSGSYYLCDVAIGSAAVIKTLNAVAWPVLTNAGGLTVKEGDCASGTAVDFGEGTTSVVKPGTALCASAPADSDSSSIDTVSGCPGSVWVVSGETSTCTFEMPSSAASVAASYTAWPVLTKGSDGVTVKRGDCTAGTAVDFGEGTTASIKAGTTMCAQVSASTGDPARSIGTETGCIGGSWQIIENSAVCIFTMPSADATVKAVYAPVHWCAAPNPATVTSGNVVVDLELYDPANVLTAEHVVFAYGTSTTSEAGWLSINAVKGEKTGNNDHYRATVSTEAFDALEAGTPYNFVFKISANGTDWFYCTPAGPTQVLSQATGGMGTMTRSAD